MRLYVKQFTFGRDSFGGKVMGRRAREWRSQDEGQLWLSALVAALEEASRPDIRSQPCDGKVLAGLRAQLCRAPHHQVHGAPAIALRH